MDIAARTVHESAIEAEKFHTAYKWSLRDWSLLHKHYIAGVESHAFALTETGNNCVLELKNMHWPKDNHGTPSARLQVISIGKMQFHTLLVTASLILQNSHKVLMSKQIRYDSDMTILELNFPSAITEKSVAEYLQDDALIIIVEFTLVRDVIVSPACARTDDK